MQTMNAALEKYADNMAEQVLNRIRQRVESGISQIASGKVRTSKSTSGRGPHVMDCRIESCKNRSKGPRFGYMCDQHRKLPKAEQRAAREKWNAKHAG